MFFSAGKVYVSVRLIAYFLTIEICFYPSYRDRRKDNY